ncbi:MAG: trigger factor [Dysgonamonadaceae bacterium]|jgi:trigger factor|nr:trigger factor [Dysgonamonadaceae bacterium]
MNITLNKIDAVNTTITVDVTKEDYTEEVEKHLRNLCRTTFVPGFRKGMVPLSRMQQLYGKAILVDEIMKIVTSGLREYVKQEKLNILGEPVLRNEENLPDYGKQENFTFIFDAGLLPPININFSKEDTLPYYLIEASDDDINTQIERFKADYGKYENAETVEGNDIVKGVLTELDETGNPKAGGVINENAVMMPYYMKSDDEKARFMDAAVGTTIVFNPGKAYDGNPAELASLLKIQKAEVQNYTGDFSFEIKEISRYKEAEVNQKLFDLVFHPGIITTEAAFRRKLKEASTQRTIPDSDSKFLIDVHRYLLEKIGETILPEASLKRWLETSSPGMSESSEEDSAEIIANLKYYLIKQQLIKNYAISVNDDEIKEAAKQRVRVQLMRAGMNDASDLLVEKYSNDILNKTSSLRQVYEEANDNKLIALLKEKVTLDLKTVTAEEFRKLVTEEKSTN